MLRSPFNVLPQILQLDSFWPLSISEVSSFFNSILNLFFSKFLTSQTSTKIFFFTPFSLPHPTILLYHEMIAASASCFSCKKPCKLNVNVNVKLKKKILKNLAFILNQGQYANEEITYSITVPWFPNDLKVESLPLIETFHNGNVVISSITSLRRKSFILYDSIASSSPDRNVVRNTQSGNHFDVFRSRILLWCFKFP